jgi:hypothetical protein
LETVKYSALTDGFPLQGPTSPPEGSTGSTVPAQTETRAGRGAPHGPSLRRLMTLTPSATVIGIYLREVSFKFGRHPLWRGLPLPRPPENINSTAYLKLLMKSIKGRYGVSNLFTFIIFNIYILLRSQGITFTFFVS